MRCIAQFLRILARAVYAHAVARDLRFTETTPHEFGAFTGLCLGHEIRRQRVRPRREFLRQGLEGRLRLIPEGLIGTELAQRRNRRHRRHRVHAGDQVHFSTLSVHADSVELAMPVITVIRTQSCILRFQACRKVSIRTYQEHSNNGSIIYLYCEMSGSFACAVERAANHCGP